MSGGAILFLSHYFWPEEMATAEMLSGVAFSLADRGFAVEALAGQPAYHDRGGKLARLLEKSGVRVRRVWSTRLDKNTAIGRILNTATFTLSAFSACLFRKRPALLVAVTNPPLLIWTAAAVGWVRRIPVILVIHDVYPQIAVELGRLRRDGWIARLWRAINRWSYRRAEAVVVLGRDMEEKIAGEIGGDRARIRRIPNWADPDLVAPRPRAGHPLLRKMGIGGNRFVVQYSGNIGRFHEIDTILDAARLLEGEDFLFLFIGDGARRPDIEKAMQGPGSIVKHLPFQPKERLGEILTACDAGLVTLRGGLTGLAVPSKLYGILAAGRPVVAVVPGDSETARVVRESDCGWIVPPGDSQGLASLLRRLKDDPAGTERRGRRARDLFESRYTLRHAADAWEKLIRETMAAGDHPGRGGVGGKEGE